MMRRVMTWIALAALIVVPLAGVTAFSLMQARDPQSLAPAPVAVLQRPGTVTDDGAMDATITATLSPGTTVTAPAWQGGVITRVDVAPGTVVSTGSALLSIDGVGRIAVASSAPFHRALAAGAKGDDVLDLERALAAMGLFGGEADGTFDAATARAVDRLGRRLGVASPGGTFDPLWAVWLPAEGLTAETVDVAVNGTVPAQGSPVFSTAPSVDRVTISGPSGAVDFSAGPYVLSQDDADVATIRGDGDVNGELVAGLRQSDDGAASHDPAASRRYDVRLRRERATMLLSVPSSAVMTGADGTATCVWGKYGRDEADYQAKAVSVSGGSLGVTYLEPSEGLQDLYVLTDPLAVMEEPPTCR